MRTFILTKFLGKSKSRVAGDPADPQGKEPDAMTPNKFWQW